MTINQQQSSSATANSKHSVTLKRSKSFNYGDDKFLSIYTVEENKLSYAANLIEQKLNTQNEFCGEFKVGVIEDYLLSVCYATYIYGETQDEYLDAELREYITDCINVN